MKHPAKSSLKLAAAAASFALLIAAVPNATPAPPATTSAQPQSEEKPQTADDMRAWLKQQMFKKKVAEGAVAASPTMTYVLFCKRSAWDRWYSRDIWWLWAQLTGAVYPHPPVWAWIENTPENWKNRFDDYQCAGADIPPPPADAAIQKGTA